MNIADKQRAGRLSKRVTPWRFGVPGLNRNRENGYCIHCKNVQPIRKDNATYRCITCGKEQ